MDIINHRPELIVIAGPNGSGKTTVTTQFLHHEWSEGVLYINPDQIAEEKFGERYLQYFVVQRFIYIFAII